MHEKLKDWIEACNECAAACENCASTCLQEDDIKWMARCIMLDRDCANICTIASAFMARGSDFAEDICRMCADICRACGEEFRDHKVDHCQKCADACERCAHECEKMVTAFLGT